MTAVFRVARIVGPVVAPHFAGRGGFSGPSALACAVLLAAGAIMLPRRDASRAMAFRLAGRGSSS